MTDWDRAHARGGDPRTSHDAAPLTPAKASMLARLHRVYGEAWPDGLTAHQAAFRAGYSPADGAWKRVSDLLTAGLIEDTGYTRPGPHGRDQRVLRLVRPEQQTLW